MEQVENDQTKPEIELSVTGRVMIRGCLGLSQTLEELEIHTNADIANAAVSAVAR